MYYCYLCEDEIRDIQQAGELFGEAVCHICSEKLEVEAQLRIDEGR